MKHVILWTAAAAFLLGIFETAILSHLRFLPVLPDLILILIVYTALYNGSAAGVIAGFFSGLIFDFLSLAPLGLHSWILRNFVPKIQCPADFISVGTGIFRNAF